VNGQATAEIAAVAARLVVEEGLEYGPAKRKAARMLGRSAARGRAMPDNDEIEDEVRSYLALFHADTQPAELAALRRVALDWMQRLADFRPHLTGAAWRGTATRLSSVHIELFCDDPKSAEIALINQGVRFEATGVRASWGESASALSLQAPSPELGEPVTVVLTILDHDDLRGALRPDHRGRSERGDRSALQRLIVQERA
jgi:hypothetical protein